MSHDPAPLPSRYNIESLLNTGVQPLADLDEEELTALGKSIGRHGPLAVPVSVSSDGRLLDGHQRLKAMLKQGRKEIMATDVRVIEEANAENALEWAVRLNVQRRHLTADEKAALARRLRAQRKWSQIRIAKVFGVSQPRVSQWLSAPADDEDDYVPPAFIEGEDGRRYEVKPKAPKVDDPVSSPWLSGGYIYKAAATTRRHLQNEDIPQLTPLQRAPLGKLLDDVIEAATEKRDQLARQDEST